MSGHVTIDLMPTAIEEFLFANPDIKSSLGLGEIIPHIRVLQLLASQHKTAKSYHLERQVPEGKKPVLLIGLRGVRGYFQVLPDRYSDDGYTAMYFKPHAIENGGSDLQVEWIARHVSGDIPESRTVPVQTKNKPYLSTLLEKARSYLSRFR